MKDYELEEILWRAVEAIVGIEVSTTDIEALKRRLYSTRAKAREAGNNSFNELALITPPAGADTRLWIIKGQPIREEDDELCNRKG